MMMWPASPTWSVTAALTLAVLANIASAQPAVYRCGPEGREYASTPCPDGKAVTVDDARSAEQRRQAKDAAQRESRLAEQLTAERRHRDAAIRPAGAVRIGPASAASAAHKAASRPTHGKKAKKKHLTSDPSLSDPIKVPAQPSRKAE